LRLLSLTSPGDVCIVSVQATTGRMSAIANFCTAMSDVATDPLFTLYTMAESSDSARGDVLAPMKSAVAAAAAVHTYEV